MLVAGGVNVMDFGSFEGIINKIDGVINTKVIYEGEELTEIHILANHKRSSKQILRDVESSILTSFNYRIDRRIVSIAQIYDRENSQNKRIKFEGLDINSTGNAAECSVKLIYNEEEYFITQVGVKSVNGRRKIIADCTVKVIEKILGQPYIFDIQDVIVNTSGAVTFVNVLVNMIIKSGEEMMIGSAIVKSDIGEAIVKATLDAINRRINMIDI